MSASNDGNNVKCGRRPVRAPPSPENCSETHSNGGVDKALSSAGGGASSGGVIFHRAREWPMPDPNDPPIKRIQFLLDRYRIKEATHVFFSDSTLRLLGEEPDFMWDIIPLICRRLRGLCQFRFRVFEGCERMLCRIAVEESCNPKEILISLLSEISHSDNAGDDNVFRAMIRPLEGTLLRMNFPSPREKSFRWTLTVLMRHIYDIELPQEYNIEGKRRLSLPNDPSIKRFIEVLPLMFNFIDEFNDKPLAFDSSPMPILTESQIDEALNGELADDDDDFLNNHVSIRSDITDASLTALLHLVGRPLAYLDLTIECKPLKSASVRCLNIILKLMPNIFAPIYKRTLVGFCLPILSQPMKGNTILSTQAAACSSSPPNAVTAIAESISASVAPLASNHFDGNEEEAFLTLAICAYIFRCCANYVNPTTSTLEMVPSFPQILSLKSMLFCHIPFVVALLRRTEILVHEKGLILLESLLLAIEEDSLDQKYLELFRNSELMQQLFHIMVYSPYCKNRRRAYNLFTQICDLLKLDCKVQMFRWVLNQTDLRPCIRAACIDQYRKHLANIQKKLVEWHQMLGLITSIPTANTKGSDEDASDNGSIPAVSKDLLRRLLGQPELKDAMDGDAEIDKLTSSNSGAGDLWTKSNFVMSQINVWQTCYKSIGGQELVSFLNLCIEACLPETQHTDIIENYELLLATLTMFRYLRLRKTLVKDDAEDQYLCAKKLKKLLFDPIRNAIAMLTTELKTHHKEIAKVAAGQSYNSAAKLRHVQVINDLGDRQPPGSAQKVENGVNHSLSRNNMTNSAAVSSGTPTIDCELPTEETLAEISNLIPNISATGSISNSNMDEPDEIECLNWVLCRLDLIDSVLVRTCDVYNC